MEIWVAIGVVGALAALHFRALRFGADSRDGIDRPTQGCAG